MDKSPKRDEMTGLTDACLDAETLAAWVDGGLSGAALEAVQLHAADCARCQALVGALGRIQAAVPAAEPSRAARWWLTWLVPLTAAAVVTAVWVAVPRDQNRPRVATDQMTAATGAARQDAAKEEAKAPTLAEPPAAAPLAQSDAANANANAKKTAAESDRLDKTSASSDLTARSAGAVSAPAPQPADAPPASSANTLNETVAGRLRADAFVNEIASPDPSVRWRIAGSTVQRSTNGGAAWDATSTGIATELVAGSAPSPLVCWVVGRAGVVLLSIDGRSWRRLAFPELTDLSGVRARDARAASISAADGRTFSTTDGGQTWVPRPLQDF